MTEKTREEASAEFDRRIDEDNLIQVEQRCPGCGGIGALEERQPEQVPASLREIHAEHHDAPSSWLEIVVPHAEDCDLRENRKRMNALTDEFGFGLQALLVGRRIVGRRNADRSGDMFVLLRRAPD